MTACKDNRSKRFGLTRTRKKKRNKKLISLLLVLTVIASMVNPAVTFAGDAVPANDDALGELAQEGEATETPNESARALGEGIEVLGENTEAIDENAETDAVSSIAWKDEVYDANEAVFEEYEEGSAPGMGENLFGYESLADDGLYFGESSLEASGNDAVT